MNPFHLGNTEDMEAIEAQRLREVGLRVTRPRVAVLGVLDNARSEGEHLLVNQIVTRTRARVAGVSTQTVYDCLEAFARVGVVRRVKTAGSAARYETRVGDNHHHLACGAAGPSPTWTATWEMRRACTRPAAKVSKSTRPR